MSVSRSSTPRPANSWKTATLRIVVMPRLKQKWAARQTIWPQTRLLHLADLVATRRAVELRMRQTQRELDDVSANLADAYEELSLLYGLTQKLKISASIEELGQKALEWLAEAIS